MRTLAITFVRLFRWTVLFCASVAYGTLVASDAWTIGRPMEIVIVCFIAGAAVGAAFAWALVAWIELMVEGGKRLAVRRTVAGLGVRSSGSTQTADLGIERSHR